MEPVAPGTEDEIKSNFPTFAKQGPKQEKFLVEKTYLPNGQYGNVFELSYNNGREMLYCNLCECPVMGRPYHHEQGKRHQNNLHMAGNKSNAIPPTIQVAPGEPVPPGVEGEIEKVAQIQERLDSFTLDPLIGLEYLFEIQEYDQDKEPSYLCSLCHKRGDPRTVIAHLTSYNHISTYLQIHFPTAFRILSPYSKRFKKNYQSTLYKLAEAIETKFGRLKLHPVDLDTFEERKMYYLELVTKGPHFTEKSGFTMEELVDVKQLTKTEVVPDTNINKPSEEVSKRTYRKSGADVGEAEQHKRSPSPSVMPRIIKKSKPADDKRKSLSSVSSISSSDLSDFDDKAEPAKSNQYNKRRDRESPRRGVYGDRRRDRGGGGGSLLPWQRSDYIRTKPENNSVRVDKWDEYKKLANAIENDMNRILKQHEKNPEKHPDYNDEWKKFWNKRYKELQNDGKDPTNYDFKPEWIEFWNKRMVELHNLEVKAKKDALRRRLGLPEEPAPISFKITNKKRQHGKDDSGDNKSETKSVSDDVIIIEDKDDDTVSSRRSQSPWEETPVRSRSRSRRRSLERAHDRDIYKPRREYDRYGREKSYERDRDYKKIHDKWERDHYHPSYKRDLADYYKPPRVMRDVTRQPVRSPPAYPPPAEPEPEEEDETDINIVGVLRLLTALEEKLGSLGPKVIDLLAQALALEKNEPNSSETLLDNDINCLLFEMVKEKLKGRLLAGLVEYAQEKAYKNAIKKIASLIHFAGERKKQKEKEMPKVDPVKVPGIGTIDKAAIAKQIATALVLQGKTDVTQAELEQLINTVVGMAEASRNANKPITTQAFLEQIQAAQQKPPESTTKNEPVSNALQALQDSNSDHNSMDGLSDSDLQTLLQNFKDLSTDEQHNLINYLKKLEAKEPERVEHLRKFVNLGGNSSEKEPTDKEKGRLSPFSNRMGSVNPPIDEKGDFEDDANEKQPPEDTKNATSSENKQEKVNLDSDEDDYSYEDVCKAATRNVKEKEMEKERMCQDKKKTLDLDGAKALIANIMGNISTKNNASSNLLGLGASNKPITPEFSHSLSNLPVNVQNLQNIMGNVQNLSNPNQKTNVERPSTFEPPPKKFEPPPNKLEGRFEPPNKYEGSRFEPLNKYEAKFEPPHKFEPNKFDLSSKFDLPNRFEPNKMDVSGTYEPPPNQRVNAVPNVMYPIQKSYPTPGGYSQNYPPHHPVTYPHFNQQQQGHQNHQSEQNYYYGNHGGNNPNYYNRPGGNYSNRW